MKLQKEEGLLFSMINEERIKAGCAPFELDFRLVVSARQRNTDIIKDNQTNSYIQDGQFAGYIRKSSGKDYGLVGEIITMGMALEGIADNLINCSHKTKYLLNPAYTHVGVRIDYFDRIVKLVTLHFGGKE